MNKSRKAFATCAVSAALLGQNFLFSQNVLAASDSMYPNVNSSAYNSNNIFTQCGFKGQCTWFTYGRALEKLNMKLPSQFYGNAIDWWYSNIRSNTFSYGSEPQANSIVVWSGGSKGYGHVGFVEKVVGDTIYYNEGNVERRGYYDGYVKTISKQAIKNRGNLFLKGYIYLNGSSNSSNNNSNNDYTIIKTSKVSCSSLNVRSNPSLSSAVIGGVSKNQTISIISESNGWAKIKYGSGIGYVSSQYLYDGNNTISSGNGGSSSNESVQPGFVKLSSSSSLLNVRSSANLSSSIIGSLKNGSSVSILGKTGSWYKIKYGSKVAYVSSNYISSSNNSNSSSDNNSSTSTGKGTVKLSSTSSSLNLRENPSLSSKILGGLSHGSSVDILGKTGSWYKIKYGSKIGYVSNQFITTSNSSNSSGSSVTNQRFGTVYLSNKYSTLNVRKNAGTNSSVISSLAYGSKVEILSSSGEWYKINFKNTTGYVYSKYIKDTAQKVVAFNQSASQDKKYGVNETKVTVNNKNAEVVKSNTENEKKLVTIKSEKEQERKKSYEPVQTKSTEEAQRKAAEEAQRKATEEAQRKAAEEAQRKEAEVEASESQSKGQSNVSEKAPTTHGDVISYARQYLGTPYVWGGTSPNGFDCSGFVQYVYRNAAGISLPRDTYGQVGAGSRVSQDQLQPGDLVFPDAGHVGIYIGGGQMIHASKPGDVVKISSVWAFYAGVRIK
ncbi:CHAP domain-containing protein [Clostridium botulinum]|uniref:SH3 domain-containing protein n=1 Tax=Clostridium botulinum TaxID=1491 RepID=UPI001A92A1D9|nr:SH3 domain-containing protein [Clostridium botulinum]MBO0525056.1 CHAP domain-containing protein [Clostridium botulinum]MBO0528577.1 CHAP domain-containing protein [Clostridium botulinum]MBO0531167.1 CHAP domain-containing protein [Clostridium botulinum]MBO0534689.1 CHAP domain-containing protein [Clostridium botulinum]MBO0537375.1 CHAP domain-containing protein [Clostridium botulinum]